MKLQIEEIVARANEEQDREELKRVLSNLLQFPD
jgi:hypothetical protein